MPSEEKMRAAADDIVHDVDLLRTIWNHSQARGWWTQAEWTTWFTLARNLIAFFQSRGQDDDAKAEHYVSDAEAWGRAVASACPGVELSKWCTASSQLASHLTYKRARYRRRFWSDGDPEPSSEVTECLLELWKRFLEHLPPGRREWFP